MVGSSIKTPLADAAQTPDQKIALAAVLSAAATLRQVMYDEMVILPELKPFRGMAGLLCIDLYSAAGQSAPTVIKREG